MTGYQTGAGNRMTNDGTWTYTYDDEGNMTKKSKGATQETWTFGYDHENHLLWAEQRATDGGTLQMRADYKYAALGDRIEKGVDSDGSGPGGTTTTRFGYDGSDVLVDLNGSNQLQMRRLYLDAIDSVFARVSSGGAAAWYLPDRLGSIRNIVDAAGAVIDHIDYEGFGKVTSESQPANGDRYKFAGYQQDSETGLYHLPGRDLDPNTGRWNEEDPIVFTAGDPNLYRYVGNNATNATDPSGLEIFLYAPTKAMREKTMSWIQSMSQGLYVNISPLTARVSCRGFLDFDGTDPARLAEIVKELEQTDSNSAKILGAAKSRDNHIQIIFDDGKIGSTWYRPMDTELKVLNELAKQRSDPPRTVKTCAGLPSV